MRPVDVKNKAWYTNVIINKNSKVVTLPHKDSELTKFISSTNNIFYISLCRLYFDNYSTPRGVVEVKKAYTAVLGNIIDFMNRSSKFEQVYIYDSTGNLIYPLRDSPSKNDNYYYKYCDIRSLNNSSLTVSNPVTHDKELLEYRYSDYTGWITAITIPEKSLLSPVMTFTKIMFIFSIIILSFALMFSFIVAKKFTKPIEKLRKSIKLVDLKDDSYTIPQDLGSGITELEELNNSFYKMNVKVKKSVDYMLLSQQHENQSRMLALQSQMNPHFLYNTLSTLSVMAEDGMNEEITEMCINISDMLRYISTDKSPLVNINAEIDYTQKYLSCMKIRYGSKLTYAFDIEEALMDIEIPKLMIQPLVENSLKFGTYNEPPWDIDISGKILEDYWQISVQDNGPGFDSEKLNHINNIISQIEQTGLLPSLELEGMGLLNIYIRLKLIYKTHFIFEISQNSFGGTTITVGGILIN